MKRTVTYVSSAGMVRCRLASGEEITLPVVQGLLKHPSVAELFELLQDPDVAEKYTLAALVKAPWAILEQFPRDWLLQCMARANLRPGRAAALTFMLG